MVGLQTYRLFVKDKNAGTFFEPAGHNFFSTSRKNKIILTEGYGRLIIPGEIGAKGN